MSADEMDGIRTPLARQSGNGYVSLKIIGTTSNYVQQSLQRCKFPDQYQQFSATHGVYDMSATT